ncbi:hypothetical protein BJ508DRAFT_362760 [Ascobolus immersus RN42]|uniref:Uncharacterized protein n=1 Tax=Ascobolus immersus RN42 TaxID=1160509 RepID=A0A3N4I268_ASCIM|nr:hypothetical protein BJ508DRAFT_362760 [Ascobolus immersus RN42]
MGMYTIQCQTRESARKSWTPWHIPVTRLFPSSYEQLKNRPPNLRMHQDTTPPG